MNNQEFFNKTVAHLVTQGQRAYAEGVCVYRTSVGIEGKVLKCAIGCHIPDELYNRNMEGCNAYDLTEEFKKLHHIFQDVDINLMQDMQRIHDDIYHWNEFGFNLHGKIKLNYLAMLYNLAVPFPMIGEDF